MAFGSGFRGAPLDPRFFGFLQNQNNLNTFGNQTPETFNANLDLMRRLGFGTPNPRASFRGANRLADPNVAAIQAKLRAQTGGPLRLPKELLGLGSTSPQSVVNPPIPAGQGVFGTPFRGAISPRDAVLKPFNKLRGRGQLFPELQGLTSTDILNMTRPQAPSTPFGQGILDKIGSKVRSQRGLNTGIGLGPVPLPGQGSQVGPQLPGTGFGF